MKSRSLLIVLACLAVVVWCGLAMLAPAADSRATVAARSGAYELILDGGSCGPLKSVEGGGVSAPVINEAMGPDHIIHKHIGQPKYEDLVVKLSLSNGKPIYDWIASSWQQKTQPKDGSILIADAMGQQVSEQQFIHALLTETTIPAMDAASKDAAMLSLKITPEVIRTVKPGAKAPAGGTKLEMQKQFLCSGFRLEIDGLDCTKVSKIDSFTVKQTTTTDAIGEARDARKEPGKLEFPNLRITLAESAAKSWSDWLEDFVVKGNNGADKEKQGSLIFLSSNQQEELGRITLHNVGICRLGPALSQDGSDQIRRVVAEVYVESMDFKRPTQTASAPPAAAPAPAAPAASASAAPASAGGMSGLVPANLRPPTKMPGAN